MVGGGSQGSENGNRQTYRCDALASSRHYVAVVLTEEGPAIAPALQRAPGCPVHPQSHVVRNGTYGVFTLADGKVRRCSRASVVLRSHLVFKGGRRDSVLFSLLPGELR